MDEIKYIAQEEPDGCLVACVAMVTGRTYGDIRAIVAPSYSGGIHQYIAHDVLADMGYAVMVRYKHQPHLKSNRDQWPMAPFAPVHICCVNVPGNHHAIVLLSDGRVFDPFKRERTTMTHPDYLSVDHMDGIYKVTQ